MTSFSVSELKNIVRNDEHNEYDDEDGNWIHADWDCIVCDAEKEIELRRYIKESKKPGHCPRLYVPGVHTGTSCSKRADELRPGMYARYLSRPGVSDYPYEYAEIISLRFTAKGKVKVKWRRTNDETAPIFTATYKASEYLNVSYTTPIRTTI